MLMALAPTLGWLFAGRVISGVAASSIATAYAYVADVDAGGSACRTFRVTGRGVRRGIRVRPGARRACRQRVVPRLPFWIAAGLSSLNACYGLFGVAEIAAARNQRVRSRGDAPTRSAR